MMAGAGRPVLRVDQSAKLVVDPLLCDGGPYTTFVGYYAIKPFGRLL